MNNKFEIPIALFIFKRYETVLRIIDVLREINPSKIYLIGDGPRNNEERKQIELARKQIEEAIDWKCKIIKNYSEGNRGVYENIAGGAKWVFTREKYAIFLEDDNLPEKTFFPFCKEMLERYKDDDNILWVCGTNYLEKYKPLDDSSYVFTKHLMPCGWASWNSKFNRYYDGDMKYLEDESKMKKIRNSYQMKSLYKQQLNSAQYEVYRRKKGLKYASWDFQMSLSIRANDLYGICPCFNQIENIGVDAYSTHGGNSFSKIMTKRFCGIKKYPLVFPLKHPKKISIDKVFEKRTGKIILFPLKLRVKEKIAVFIKKLFGISKYEKFKLKKR